MYKTKNSCFLETNFNEGNKLGICIRSLLGAVIGCWLGNPFGRFLQFFKYFEVKQERIWYRVC